MKSLQNISYKTLFTILFLSLAGIVFFLKIGSKTQKVSAAWWDEMWHYRQFFSVSNTSGSDQNNMVVKINLNTSTLISNGKIQVNCNDIRITDINGNILQQYVTQCNNSATNVYAKIPIIPSSGSGIYLYYGNSQANNVETSEIFTYFDDFESGTPKDTWTTTQLSVGVTSGFSNKGNYSIKYIAQGASYDNLYQTFTSSNNWTDRYFEYEFYTDVAGASWVTDPRNSSGTRMNPWISFSMTATSWITFSGNINTNTYKDDIKSIMYFTSSDDINRNIYIDNFRIRPCLSTITIGTTQSEELSPGPIAYWKFDEGVGTTAYDSSSNQNSSNFGPGNSAPTWADESQCVVGKCLSFDGIQYLSAPDNTTFDIYQEGFTYNAWIKGNNFSDTYNMFMGHHLPYFNVKSTGVLHMSMSAAGAQRSVLGSTVLNTDTWYFATATYDSQGYMKVYLNGKLDGTAGPFLIPSNYSYNMFIGKWTSGSTYMFNGLIDEVKIYPYARTAAQIKLDYNSRGSMSGAGVNLGVRSNTAPSIKSKLVAYWKFNENVGTTIYDSSGYNNTGVLYGANWTPVKNGIGLSLGGYGSNNYIGIVQTALDNDTTWSVSAKLKYFDLSKTFEFFLGKNDSTTGKILLRHNGYVSFRSTNSTYYDFSITSAEINNLDNTLTFISDGTTIQLYINGIYKSSVTPASTSFSINTIGNAWTDTVWTSAFLVDEVKIYNSALSADEIKQDYNQGSAISFGTTNQTIGGTTTSLEYCIPGDASACSAPIAEWNFEENTGTIAKDTSGNNNTGTFGTGNSAPTWTIGKKNTGAGISLTNENQYVTSSAGSNQNFTSAITVTAWVKKSSAGSNYDWIVNKGTTSTDFGLTFASGSTTQLRAFKDSGSVYTDSNTFPSIADNKWHHTAVTFDNPTSSIQFYLDGKILGVASTSSFNFNPLNTNNNNYSIGAWWSGGSPNHYFKGSIDEVKVYNYARTPAQIAYDYNRGGPIAHWKFDECQGSTAFDSSGLGNTGAISIGQSGSQNTLGTCAIGTSAAWTNGSTGKINSSLNFDGNDDYIQTSIGFTGTTSYTASIWVYIDPSFPSNRYNRFFGTQSWATGRIGIMLKPNYILAVNTYFGAGYDYWQDTGIAVPFNSWFHVAVTFDRNGNQSIYYNGTLKSSLDISPASSINWLNGNIRIACGTAGDANYVPHAGKVDDVRIYNYALTLEQVKVLYNGGAVNFR